MAEGETPAIGDPGAGRYVWPMASCFFLGLLFLAAAVGLNIRDHSQIPSVLLNTPEAAPAAEEGEASPATDPTADPAAAPAVNPAATLPAGKAAAPAAEAPAAPPADSAAAPAAGADEPSPFASPGAEAAEMGAFLAFRGNSALTMAVAVAGSVVALFGLFLFVPGRAQWTVGLVLGGQAGLAAYLALAGGSAMADVAWQMTCAARPGSSEPWDFCAMHSDPASTKWVVEVHFNAIVNAVCSAATCVLVFAIFVIARSDEPENLPSVAPSREKWVTLLLIAASALLVALLLHDRSFLNWTFADFLALEEPPGDVTAYIDGTATFNGAVQTALLGLTWFIALLFLQRPHRKQGSAVETTGGTSAGFSLYNLPAIFAPALSAIASNFFGGG